MGRVDLEGSWGGFCRGWQVTDKTVAFQGCLKNFRGKAVTVKHIR